MDIFNKKKIKELDIAVHSLRAELDLKLKNLKDFQKAECLRLEASVPDKSYFQMINDYLIAIMDYLDIIIKGKWEDDPEYLDLPKKQIKVWQAERKPKIKK